MNRTIVVLAAGQGTRMKSPLAKVLHPLLGRPLLAHLLEGLAPLKSDRTLVVVGHQAGPVGEIARHHGAATVLQEPQSGTGHALFCCREALAAQPPGTLLLLAGDVPLIPVKELASLWEQFEAGDDSALIVSLGLERPYGYGRILRGEQGDFSRIVEERDASAAERAVTEVNSGVYFLRSPGVFEALAGVGTANAQGEMYLTDVFAALAGKERPPAVAKASDPDLWLGVNSQADLARATAHLRQDIVRRWMDAGVCIADPDTTWIEPGVMLGRGVVLHPFVRLCGQTVLADGVEVRAFSCLHDVHLGPGTLVKEHCVLEGTRTGAGCILGPFTRTREGTALSDKVHLGNFVETKKTVLGDGVKANHLSYLGDATVGAGSNIGAGTITCNYDGVHKHPTVLGERVFVGSDTQLVAPVTVGDGAYIGAGTTITKDVPPGALAITRVPQKNVEGWVARKKAKRP